MFSIEYLRSLRISHPLYDEELWSFAGKIQGNNLVNITDDALRYRLTEIERNILYLDGPNTLRDELKPERGWLSPWWWWRMRHWTLAEFIRRGLSPSPRVDIPAMPGLHPEFVGTFAGGRKLLARISRRDRVLEALEIGRLRFAPATSYTDAKLDAARADEEMAKSYHRPGQSLTITGPRGGQLTAIGDVTFATKRAVETAGILTEVPYWFCSFSSDLDPRLFAEFPDPEGAESACLVIFDPMEFVRRALPALNQVAPIATKHLFPNEYFDPHHPPIEPLSATRHKHFSFSYQREMRFMIDPEGNPWSACASDKPFFVEIGSISDIAAVYAPSGNRISGTGPNSFLSQE